MPDVAFRTDEGELEELRENLVAFVGRAVETADARGVVVCMSGGIDSTLSAYLCVEALGPDRVTALVLPCTLTDAENTLDAHSVAEELSLDPAMVQLQPVLDSFEETVAPTVEESAGRIEIGNAVARLRMTVAYYTANVQCRLVCGTSNRTEFLLGYFTKYGDGVV
jgi:NAD+ synthase